jgi:site-specific recombinase XerD
MAEKYEHYNASRRAYTASLTLDKYSNEKIITYDDRLLITGYVDHRRAVAENLSPKRADHLMVVLSYWRRYLKVPYRAAGINDVRAAVSSLKGGVTLKGRPYKQNSKHDYIAVLKSFFYWMIDEKISTIEPRYITEIKTPKINKHTTEPQDILRDYDVLKMLDKTINPMHRALISVHWESGARPEEVVSLQWRDFQLDEYGFKLWVTDFKTSKKRFARLTMAAPYISDWKNTTRHGADDCLVFTTQRRTGMAYSSIAFIYNYAKAKTDITKPITAYSFRKGRINDMIEKHYPYSAILAQIWGNQDSRMLGTYLSQSDADIDHMLLEHQGLLKPEDKKPDALAKIPCPYCHADNRPTAKFCDQCRRPLNKVGVDELEGASSDLARLLKNPKFRALFLEDEL